MKKTRYKSPAMLVVDMDCEEPLLNVSGGLTGNLDDEGEEDLTVKGGGNLLKSPDVWEEW